MQLAEGFGNYLYIIFAVVYVIYSIIKAGKKVTQNRPTIGKQSPSPTVEPPASSPLPEMTGGDEFKKMLEDLMGGGSQEEIPEKQVVQPRPRAIPAKPAKIFSSVPKKERPVNMQSKPKTVTPAPAFVAHPEIVQKVFTDPIPEEEGIDFDIRQAIIYSEILKRPQH